MPYIKKEDRERAGYGVTNTAGELNYAFTQLIVSHLKDNGKNYQTINDCLGALEGCKLEFYRRVAVPYENRKKNENGDVFEDTWKAHDEAIREG